ncbi:methionine--tRNA ligase [Methanobrevibacter cuticularis]|uniref:Methionine--tRNA ligase n=1 Tax=Methanobrevibacter cuticularis TaxID=47311 RepID=A0A166CJG6_9EURY|nr:methionine--tRNA ligase [Methanobrevibacter cuticularis]KZX14837.1 methionine--tRNA ligase [Methanobrevibacter cuticularis]
MSKIFISCALPYANGPCHLGHLRSTYIPADIYARYNRMMGNDVLLVCATDEHGTPIAVKADKEGKQPIEIATRYHNMITKDLKSCDISLDSFTRTTDEIHYKISQDFFLDLYNKDLIYEKEIKQLYCEVCEKFLPDRYVEGTCNFCKSERARGDHCEACGRHLEPTDLINPKCLTCGHTPIIRESKHYFFRLSNFQKQVEDFIYNTPDLPANVKNYTKNWLKEGLKDWILSRDMDWGIPIPLKEGEGKIIYVWVEALLGYISSAAQWSKITEKPWEEYWNDKTLHFIGKDIIYHHAIFWPAILTGYGCKLPDNIIAGEYLSLEGKKMSTSQNWVIWVSDFVKKYDSDLLRYYLTINAPLNKDTDFSWDDFGRRINDELADVLGNFLHRTFTFTKKFFDSSIPNYENPNDEDVAFELAISEVPDKVGSLISEFKFREGLVEIVKIAKQGNKYFNDQEPWKTVKEDKQRAANSLYLCNQLSKILAIVLKPYIPNKAQKIGKIMNISDDSFWEDSKIPIKSGHKINKPKPLFKKIEEETIKEEKMNLYKELEEEERANLSGNINISVDTDIQKENKEKTEEKGKDREKDKNKGNDTMSDIITIDDFAKMDIRIGEIVNAERIEGSDKLLKLKVNIKEKELQVVAGIAEKYSPEDLKNKKVAVLVNLKPAKLFGVKSEGMLLATNDSVALLSPDKCEIGEKIR